MNILSTLGMMCTIAFSLTSPGDALAQPAITSPEQMAATRELSDLHALGAHRSSSTMKYQFLDNYSHLSCLDDGTSGDRRFFYPITSPPHLLLERIQVWGFKSGSGSMRARVLRVCQLNGGLLAPMLDVLSEDQTSEGSSGTFLLNLPVGGFGSLAGCSEMLEVRMAPNGENCRGAFRTTIRVRAQAFNPEHIFRDGFLPREVLTAPSEILEARP